jgi:uncharacterized SAM-binding protein YcdF (DUF218 family)
MTYSNVLVLLFSIVALAGLARLPRSQRLMVPVFAVLGLLLVSWPPVDWLLSRPLEIWYTVQPFPKAPAQAIVVLSSNVSPPEFQRPFPLVDHDTFTRCRYAAWLYQHWKPLPILACGGVGRPGTEPFSQTMRELLRQNGVPDSMIWTEDRSHSTRENAVNGSVILQSHGIRTIALVVEAQSMPRAAACFRKLGITVVPAPSDFRTWGPTSEEIMPDWKALRRNENTVHEAGGLVWYWLHGWI